MKKQKVLGILSIICLVILIICVIIEGVLIWTDNYKEEEDDSSEETYITCIAE